MYDERHMKAEIVNENTNGETGCIPERKYLKCLMTKEYIQFVGCCFFRDNYHYKINERPVASGHSNRNF